VIRSDKVGLVENLNEAFAKTPHIFLATFNGLKVNQVNELRTKVRDAGGTYRVIKNRLAKRAAAGTSLPSPHRTQSSAGVPPPRTAPTASR